MNDKYRNLSKKLWAAYRHNPVIPATLGELRRGALRGVIGGVASVTHLKETLGNLRTDDFRLHSPLTKDLQERLRKAEELLLTSEEALYGVTIQQRIQENHR